MIPHELTVFPGVWALIVAIAVVLGLFCLGVYAITDYVARVLTAKQ